MQPTGNNAGFGTWLGAHGYNDANVISAAVANPNTQASAYQNYLAEAAGGGGGGGAGRPGAAPTFDLVGATNSAYNTPEILAANNAVTGANTELTTRQTALASAQAEINDNPFYSEATRVGKSQMLTQQANNDMSVIQTKISQAQTNVASLKSDAAIKVNAALGQYNIENQQYQQKLQQFDSLLQAGAITNMNPNDLANVAVQTGIPLSELQSIQNKQKSDNVKTALITGNDGTISIINANTGDIISQSKPGLGPTVTAKSGSGNPSAYEQKLQQEDLKSGVFSDLKRLSAPDTGYVSKEDWAKVKQNAISQGYDPSQFNSDMVGFTNPSGSKNGYNYI